ncbi:general vesicular transport factor p115 [Bombyx mori]|uniref:Vesicle tethering protein Uso1/P115-like head domain-containing protein n=1 Tax=Bombyx mori TaxID=7091 RepID=A0A8R2R3D2_BOMMO|nr:general vesicular transport factor p115 [Bombyx mori]
MDFLKSGIKTVLGSPEVGTAAPSPAETVERLVERVTNSTLLQDRRDSCRALKALSQNYRIEVGAQAMDALRQVLELDRADNETIHYALDTLKNIMSPTLFKVEEDNHQVPCNIGEQFTEMFIKDPQNVQLVLDLLDEYDFRVRLSAVQLLTFMLTNRTRDIQEIILVKPMGVSKMIDLLGDTREVVRNETLLLLIKLTKGNANIQKIVAFENTFDRLFEIIASEGHAEGGIIVEDCLLLMLNLLKNNSSNVNFFKEGSYVQRLLPLLATRDDEAEEAGWAAQRVANVQVTLLVVRALVGGQGAGAGGCRRAVRAGGVLAALCGVLMSSGVPAAVLADTILAVADAVRAEPESQDYLAQVTAPSDPPRPTLLVLLMCMLNEKQPFQLRCAVLYCFECFLYRNESQQAALVSTLLPTAGEAARLTAGQLLCGGLFSRDAAANWFAAVALSHALRDNPEQKRRLLRVVVAAAGGGAPESLVSQCGRLLQRAADARAQVALLMLLSHWAAGCPAAAAALLGGGGAVGWAVSQAADTDDPLLSGLAAFLLALLYHYNDDSVPEYTKEALKQVIVKRIGLEAFVSRLSSVSRLEPYSAASKQPQPVVAQPHLLSLDYEFCNLYREHESLLLSGLAAEGPAEAEHPDTLAQYRALIRQQDARLHELVAQLDQLLHNNRTLQNTLNDSLATNSHLKDENTLLKAQVSAAGAMSAAPRGSTTHDAELKERELQEKIELQDAKLREYESEVEELRTALRTAEEGRRKAEEELVTLRKDQDDLLVLVADQDLELNKYKELVVSAQGGRAPAEP